LHVLKWLVAAPLGIVGGIGLGIVGIMTASGTSDGGRLGILLLGLAAGALPWLFARATSVGGVLRRGAIVMVLEALAILAAGYAYPLLSGHPALGPEDLQWLRQPEALSDWANAGYGRVAMAVICALLGALGLAVRVAGRQSPAPPRTRTSQPSATATPEAHSV
jgi:hypothetical protein